METKYPKKIREIMRDAPMAYSMLVLLDYNNGSASATELYRRWKRDKKIFTSNTVIYPPKVRV